MSKLKTNQPLVSVIMPMFNAVEFVAETIRSIQNQTYPNWELIIIDDYSADASRALAKKIAKQDNRISVFRNGKHRGVSGAANLALAKAKGQFVARMDADDLSSPDRLAKQVRFLQKHKQVVAVGSQCYLIDKHGQKTGTKTFPLDFESVKNMMFYSIPLQQPSLMVNRNLLPSNFVWYRENYQTAEEVELLFKFFKYGEVVNLPDYLLSYRIHGNNISLRHPKSTFFLTFKTRWLAVWHFGYKPTVKGIFITIAQAAVVFILPEPWIFPLYAFLRGFRKHKWPSITVTWPNWSWQTS